MASPGKGGGPGPPSSGGKKTKKPSNPAKKPKQAATTPTNPDLVTTPTDDLRSPTPTFGTPADVPWTDVVAKRKRSGRNSTSSNSSSASTVSSSRSSPSPSRSVTTPPRNRKLLVELGNLPLSITTKAIAEAINIAKINIIDVRPYRGRAVLASRDPEIVTSIQRNLSAFPKGMSVKQITQPQPQPQRIKLRSFSCVLRNVDADITVEEIKKALDQDDLRYRDVWRIRSRATNEFTKFIRIVTEDLSTVNRLLENGLRLYYRVFKAEESHPPPPAAVQCTRCFEFNHTLADCKNKLKCARCTGPHHISQCKQEESKQQCSNCNGAHHPSAAKCPKKPTGPEITQTAPVKLIVDHPPHIEIVPIVESMLKFQIMTAINLYPEKRTFIIEVMNPLCIALFGRSISYNPSGQAAFISLKKTTPAETKLLRGGPRIPGFTSFNRPANGVGRSGGAAVLVRNSFPAVAAVLPGSWSSLMVAGATVATGFGNWTCYALYNRPRDELPSQMFEEASRNGRCIIAGDFNARHDSFGDSSSNRNGAILKDILNNTPLDRLPCSSPTFLGHQGQSIIDHILVSSDLSKFFPFPVQVGACVASDHVPIFTNSTYCSQEVLPPRRYRVYSRADWNGFRTEVSEQLARSSMPDETEEGLEEAVAQFTNLLIRSADNHIPTRLDVGGKIRAILPADVIALIKEKRRIYRHLKRSFDPALKSTWNRLNAVIKRKTAEHREKAWCEACGQLDWRNGSRFWAAFRRLTGQTSTSAMPITRNSLPIYSNAEKANYFAEHLEKTFTVNEGGEFDERHREMVESWYKQLLIDRATSRGANPGFTESEVQDLLSRAKRSAPGPDGLTWTILKELPELAVFYLTYIYNTCVQLHYFPRFWKKSRIILIPKPGKNPASVGSYRPISLLNTMGKLLERLLLIRLQELVAENHLLPDSQYGFRAGRATTDAVLRMQDIVTNAMNANKCALGVLLDVERAYDSVWHPGLLFKLTKMGVPPAFVRLCTSYLADRRAEVSVRGSLSREFDLRAGLPQGGVLSCLLFNLYVADMRSAPGATLLQYADDTALVSTGQQERTAANRLQKGLDRLMAWASLWRIRFNPLKTQLVLFRRRKFRRKRGAIERDAAVQVSGTWVHPSSHADYLGIRLDRHLSWNAELVRTLGQFKRRTALLYRLRPTIGCSSRTLMFTYKMFVRPVVEFRWNALINSQSALQSISAAERAVIRRVHGVQRDYPSNRVHDLADVRSAPIVIRLLERGLKHLERRGQLSSVDLSSSDAHEVRSSQEYTRPRRPRPASYTPPVTEVLAYLDEELADSQHRRITLHRREMTEPPQQ